MAVSLTGTGGLFTRLGKMAGIFLSKTMENSNVTASPSNASWGLGGVSIVSLGTAVTGIVAQFASADQDIMDGIYAAQQTERTAVSDFAGRMPGLANVTLGRMVAASYTLNPRDIPAAMAALVNQMNGTANVTKNICTVAISNGTTNYGNPLLAMNHTDPVTCSLRENLFAENISLAITTDAQNGGTAGSETITILGQASVATTDYAWPSGSGTSTTGTLCDPVANASVNLLTDSAVFAFSGGLPTNWTVTTGDASTIASGSSSYVPGGTTCLRFNGTVGELTQVRQNVTLAPNTVYAIWAAIKSDIVPGSGGLTFALINATNSTVLTDNAGTQCNMTKTMSGSTTSFVPQVQFIRTPKVLPPATAFQIKLTTAIGTGSNASIQCALTAGQELYAGGPYVAGFRGSTDVLIGDVFYGVTTNNNGGLWQQTFDRFFDMRGMGLQLPSNTTGSISSTLIS